MSLGGGRGVEVSGREGGSERERGWELGVAMGGVGWGLRSRALCHFCIGIS